MSSIDLTAVDLNLLVAFEALWLEQSVSGAALRLHLGQPAVSSALARLRRIFEDELFVRAGRDMKPTAKAQAIAPDILQSLQIIRSVFMNHDRFEPSTATREFKIATSDYLANLILPELVKSLAREAPHLSWRILPLEKESIIRDLERGNCDLAIGTFGQLTDSIHSCPFIDDSFVGICRTGHPILSEPISLDSLVAFPHALFTLKRDHQGMIDEVLARHQLERRVALTVPYWFVLPSAILHSDLLAIIPNCLACHFVNHYPVEKFTIPLELPQNNMVMAWGTFQAADPGQAWLRQKILSTKAQLF